MLQRGKRLGTKASSMRAHLGLTKIAFRDCRAVSAQKDQGSEQLERKPGKSACK